jgi:hypothetical protein
MGNRVKFPDCAATVIQQKVLPVSQKTSQPLSLFDDFTRSLRAQAHRFQKPILNPCLVSLLENPLKRNRSRPFILVATNTNRLQASCFQPFKLGRQLNQLNHPVQAEQPPNTLMRPALDDPFLLKSSLSPRKLTTLFVSGFAAALAGQWVVKSLFQSGQPATSIRSVVSDAAPILPGPELKQQEVNIWLLMQEKLTSMVGLAIQEPEQRKTLMAYGASSVLGYLLGSAAEGTQETWVRREETLIRSRLLNRLTGTVQESIRLKHQQDQQLKQATIQQLTQLLTRHGLSAKELISPELPIPVEPLGQINRQFFEPTHRNTTPLRFGQSQAKLDLAAAKPLPIPEAIAFSTGAFSGWLCQQFLSTLGRAHQALNPSHAAGDITKKIVQTINVPNEEALFVLGWNRHKSLILAVMGLGAAIKVGKLWLDGLREIEVTRINADTEYRYQHHNWLALDPQFHWIAEQEAVNQELSQLGKEMPQLKQSPALLRQRIQTLLNNIGRNSAPKYFPMIPMVGLREARS